jgi:thiamine biosynthesis lipoprotein
LSVGLRDLALSVSGRAYKSFVASGRTYAHVMDPRTARPVEGVLGVAVLSTSATEGDALDNALFVQGLEAARRLIARRPGTRAFFFVPGGEGGSRMVRLGE